MTTNDVGRRKAARVKARLKVRFKDANAFISEYTHNISKGGIFVRTKKGCPVDSRVEVIIVMPESEREISAFGDVIHVIQEEEATQAQPAGMGIELKEIAEEDRKAIEEFINQRLGTPEKDKVDRREHERYEARIRVKFGSREAMMEEYSHNISHGGIFIRTEKPKKMGEKLKVILTHPETGEEMILKGEVVRVVKPEKASQTGQPPGMGIKFVDIDKHTRAQLDSFINSDEISGA